MSVPTQPTATLIVTEAYKLWKGASYSPSATEVTRATDYGIEFVKNDLNRKGWQWDFLRRVGYLAVTTNVSRITAPTDYKRAIAARLLCGTRTGTAQAAAASSITLASSDSGTSATTQGKIIVILSATAGSGQALQVSSYNSSTKVATLETSWATTPTGTITYLVVDYSLPLSLPPVYASLATSYPKIPGRPTAMVHRSNTSEGDFYLDTAPDTTYAIELEYYMDILKVDLTASTDPYSHILRLLNLLFVQGVYVYLLHNDSRFKEQKLIYDRMLLEAAGQYLYPNNVTTGQSNLDYE